MVQADLAVSRQQSVSLHERIHFLDIVRGFAMLGIIIVNYFLMTDSVNALITPATDGWHRFAHWFVEGKFYMLFSFLFGVGFMIFMDRAERRSDRSRMLFGRRLTILLGLGLLHITFVWVGDILALYAITGYCLIAFYRRRLKTLVIWITSMLAVFSVLPFIILLIGSFVEPHSGEAVTEAEQLTSYRMDLAYLQSIGERWTDMGALSLVGPYMMLSVLSMFLFGMLAVRKGLFYDMDTKQFVWRRIWLCSAIGYLLTQISFIVGTVLDTANETTVFEAFGYLGQTLGGLTGSMFYMSSLAMLYLYSTKLRRLLMLFSYVGRMSLTCYLLHTIAGTLLFLGYGFGLADEMGPAGIVLTSCGMYVILALLSYFWLRRATYGPAEWLWRRLTYGRR